MGKRLPPGEAERRAAERRRATFSGEKYKTYDPSEGGYGSYAEWASMAAAFLAGDVLLEAGDESAGNPNPAADQTGKPARPRHANPTLALLGLDAMPDNVAILSKAYRAAVMAAFKEAGSVDTSPQYVNAFSAITRAFDTVKRQKGW